MDGFIMKHFIYIYIYKYILFIHSKEKKKTGDQRVSDGGVVWADG